MITLKIKILDKSIPVPEYAHKGDAGLDLYSSISCELKPFERKKIPTGIKVLIPNGYAGFIQPRSGIALKKGVGMVNSPGLIDSGYRGEICAILINYNSEESVFIKKGDKICQMVIKKIEHVKIKLVEDLDNTERGESGFGSTDK
jgi:dUTP pyrophosphatase